MEITDVKIHLFGKHVSKTKAVASITFDHAFAVHDIKIVDGRQGLKVVMPNRKTYEDEYIDIVHPIDSHARQKIEEAVLKKYLSVEEELAVRQTS